MIIGGGAIACEYDSQDSRSIKTHIHAALTHPEVILECLVEPNANKRNLIKKKWKGNYLCLESIDKALKVFNSDILVIASPTNTHLSIIKKIIAVYKPKVILCEKPTVSDKSEWAELNDLITHNELKILTNFSRRFDPSINQVSKFLKTEHLVINHFFGTFPKGLIHNGSHLVDLLCLLIPGEININGISCVKKDGDYFGHFKVKIDEINGFFCNIDIPELSLFELIIFTNLAKIEITNSFIRIHKLIEHPELLGYQFFGDTIELPLTSSKSTFNSLEAALRMDKDDVFLESINQQQFNVGHIIYSLEEQLSQASS
jgi:hypothetical protein